jgi:tetratricopeptide (TPR) repeat protein
MLGEALHETGRLDEASAVLDAAIAHGDSFTAADALVKRTHLRSHGIGVAMNVSLADVDRALEQLGDDGPPASLSDAYATRALMLFFGGRIADAGRDAERAVEHALRAGDARAIGQARGVLMSALTWSDVPWAEVEQRVREWLASAGEVGPRWEARLWVGLARCVWARLEFAEARELLAASRQRLLDLGQTLSAISQASVNANLEWVVGDFEAAERISREAWDLLGQQGERGFRSTLGTQLAGALVYLGRLEEAEAVLDEAEPMSSPDDYVTNYTALDQRARIAAARGDGAAAAELVERSRAIIDATDAFEHRVYHRITAAETQLAAGNRDEAQRLVDESIRLTEQRGSLALVERARAVLATMPA